MVDLGDWANGGTMANWTKLWRDEEGQDLTEYTLLLAAIALTTAALVTSPMVSVNKIWVTANNELNTAVSTASS
jgi:Flp pilus assembly pilin Flp